MREALRLARAGETEQARQLLIEILRQNNDNFDAWVVMAQVTDNRKEAITCIKQALRLRPDDERAQRYLDYLLHGDQQAGSPSFGMLKTSHWLLAGVSAAAIICLAVALIIFLPRLGSQEQTGQSGHMSSAQPVADCAALINNALEISDEGCQQIGRNEVCYGHNTVHAELAAGSNTSFDAPGKTIPINILERFIASPLDVEKGDWGVGVFKLEANLPGTLPGQVVTMLVFGNTALQNISGDMQAFYFASGLGGIQCDAVPFDGILVNMAKGSGIAFKANGADVTLQGNSILRAVSNDSMLVSILRGSGIVTALGRSQSLGSGQTLTVPLGGSNGMEAEGPPNPPVSADDQTVGAGCTLTGEGCPGSGIAEQVPTNTPLPIDPSIPTNTPVPVAPGRPTNTPVPLPTNTSAPLPTQMPVPTRMTTTAGGGSPATSAPAPTTVRTSTPTPTKSPTPTNTSAPTSAPVPTNAPVPTSAPAPTNAPVPTSDPAPTNAPEPTTDVCSTIGIAWGGVSNKKVTLNLSSGASTTLVMIQISWPSANGTLKKIDSQNVDAAPTSTTVAVSTPVSGSTSITFMFENAAADTGYTINLTFTGGCAKPFSQ